MTGDEISAVFTVYSLSYRGSSLIGDIRAFVEIASLLVKANAEKN